MCTTFCSCIIVHYILVYVLFVKMLRISRIEVATHSQSTNFRVFKHLGMNVYRQNK